VTRATRVLATGIVLTSAGEVLTNNHVIDRAAQRQGRLPRVVQQRRPGVADEIAGAI
jgi:S1-C subfamily serine protease